MRRFTPSLLSEVSVEGGLAYKNNYQRRVELIKLNCLRLKVKTQQRKNLTLSLQLW